MQLFLNVVQFQQENVGCEEGNAPVIDGTITTPEGMKATAVAVSSITSSEDVEAPVSAVDHITDHIASEDPIIIPNDLIVTDHLVTIDTSVAIDVTLVNEHTKATDTIITNSSNSNKSSINNASITTEPIVIQDPIITNNSDLRCDHSVSTDQIVMNGSKVALEVSALASMTTDIISRDKISLFQQFQSNGIVSSGKDGGSIPLILDDVTFLNIEPSEENLQIISLTELDPSLTQTEVSYRNLYFWDSSIFKYLRESTVLENFKQCDQKRVRS